MFQLWEDDEIPDVAKLYIDNIKIYVYDMWYLPKETRSLFRSDMRIIVDYLADGKDYVPTQQKIVHLEALLRLLKALTGDERYEAIILEMAEVENEQGGVNMCELLDKYDERKSIEFIRNLMETMKMTADQAMAALKIPECEREKYLAKL